MDFVTMMIIEFSFPIAILIILHSWSNDWYKDWRIKWRKKRLNTTEDQQLKK
jgi:hypothetical protein